MVSPKTEIEDALNGKLFLETLKEFETEHADLKNVLSGINEPSEEASYFALDLSPSKAKLLESFFDNGNNKFKFAKKYSSLMSSEYQTPKWIANIKALY